MKKLQRRKEIRTHLYTIHAKHVTNMPDVILLPHGIHGKRLYGKNNKQQYRWHTAETEKWGHLKNLHAHPCQNVPQSPQGCMNDMQNSENRTKGYKPRG